MGVLPLVLLGAACIGPEPPHAGTGPRVGSEAKPETLTVRPGESRWTMSGRLHVTFEGIGDDSRCPIDAVCVHAGDATAHFRLRHSGGSDRVTLHAAGQRRAAQVGALQIEILELLPYPLAGEATPFRQYVSRIRISAT